MKFFDSQGQKLADPAEEQIEELLAAAPGIDPGRSSRSRSRQTVPQHILERFGTDLTGLRIAVDCANGASRGSRRMHSSGAGRGACHR